MRLEFVDQVVELTPDYISKRVRPSLGQFNLYIRYKCFPNLMNWGSGTPRFVFWGGKPEQGFQLGTEVFCLRFIDIGALKKKIFVVLTESDPPLWMTETPLVRNRSGLKRKEGTGCLYHNYAIQLKQVMALLRGYYDKTSRGASNDILTVLETQLWYYISSVVNHLNDVDPLVTMVHIQSRSGFGKALQSCLRLKPGALLSIGLPCCSFVWINRFTSQRSCSSPWGDQEKQYVSDHNATLGEKFMVYFQ